ncbi:ATP-binding protein, partial [bacterium]
ITTPQDVALLDARKTVSFSRALGVPVIGIVENMSGFTCPYCGKKIDIFKTGGAIKAAKQMNLNFLGDVPLDPKIVDSSDDGKPFITAVEDNPNAEKLEQIAENIMNIIEKNKIT